MNEQYIEWLFLREHIKDWAELNPLKAEFKSTPDTSIYNSYVFHGKSYNIHLMKERYIELTKQLLRNYKL